MSLIALATLTLFVGPTEQFTRFTHPGKNFGELRASWPVSAELTDRTGGHLQARLRTKAGTDIVNVFFGDYSDWRERQRYYRRELLLNWPDLRDGMPSGELMEGYVGHFNYSETLRDGRTSGSTTILVANDMCAISTNCGWRNHRRIRTLNVHGLDLLLGNHL